MPIFFTNLQFVSFRKDKTMTYYHVYELARRERPAYLIPEADYDGRYWLFSKGGFDSAIEAMEYIRGMGKFGVIYPTGVHQAYLGGDSLSWSIGYNYGLETHHIAINGFFHDLNRFRKSTAEEREKLIGDSNHWLRVSRWIKGDEAATNFVEENRQKELDDELANN
jgi:hypothetical protein